jgi:hypothetical protein
MACSSGGRLEASIASAMLEQEAHTLGLRENELPFPYIGSPQQMQMREFMATGLNILHGSGGKIAPTDRPNNSSTIQTRQLFQRKTP